MCVYRHILKSSSDLQQVHVHVTVYSGLETDFVHTLYIYKLHAHVHVPCMVHVYVFLLIRANTCTCKSETATVQGLLACLAQFLVPDMYISYTVDM